MKRQHTLVIDPGVGGITASENGGDGMSATAHEHSLCTFHRYTER